MYKVLLVTTLLCIAFPVFSQTYYVDAARPDNTGAGTSWATAKRDLQVAINGAASGDNVWIKAGTYIPTHDPFGSTAPANNRDKTFTLKNGVKVYGGFAGTETQLSQRNWQANITTLSGDLGVLNTLTDNAYHVVLSVNAVSTTILDGVVISKGYATAITGSSITVNTRAVERCKGGGLYNAYSAATFNNITVRRNSADNTDGNNDAWGAGVFNDACTASFTNSLFDANSFLNGGTSFGVFGSGMMILGGACIINNCAFVNNSSGSGFFDGSTGGGLYLRNGSAVVTNSIFYNNRASNGAAIACGGGSGNLSAFTNCTFANNTSEYTGTGYSGFAKAIFRNSIFWNNTPTSSSIPGRNEVYSAESNTANQPAFINCIVRDATGTPLAVTNTIMTNCSNANPLFAALPDGDGADNVFMTADDGLRLLCTSPAIGGGTGSTPVTDILNLPRTATIDMGAYEGGHNNASLNPIPSVNTTVQLSQNASGATHYADCSSKLVELQSGGSYTVSGTVTAKVWIESAQPPKYVKRHYEITPATNAASATGKLTLYFTQQEFTDFNAVNTLKLPTGPADAAGIANIRIEKRGGTSSTGTGLPNTYSGTIQTISSGALLTSWNAAAARWEISFDVAGFSGFFVKTQAAILPLRLLNFTVAAGTACNKLQWQTTQEINTGSFDIEKSTNGITFNSIGTRTAIGSGNNHYQFDDCSAGSGKVFYRLKMMDINGNFTYSPVVSIDRSLSISPNPAKDVAVISSNDISLINTIVKVTDAGGRLVQRGVITSLPHSLNVRNLPQGLYYIHFINGTTLKMIK